MEQSKTYLKINSREDNTGACQNREYPSHFRGEFKHAILSWYIVSGESKPEYHTWKREHKFAGKQVPMPTKCTTKSNKKGMSLHWVVSENLVSGSTKSGVGWYPGSTYDGFIFGVRLIYS